VQLVPTLKYHRDKHDVIKAMQVVMTPIEFLLECALDWEDQREKDPTKVSERPWTDIIPKFQRWAQEMTSNPHSDAALKITWWESADAIKNSGLYVDYKDGEWKYPNDVVGDSLDSALKYAEDVVKRSEQLHAIPFEQIVADFYKVKNEMQQRSLKESE
jgi:AbiV family abortive infection protein